MKLRNGPTMISGLSGAAYALLLVVASTVTAEPPAGTVREPTPTPKPGFSESWSLPGDWLALGADPANSAVYALKFGGKVVRIADDGKSSDVCRLRRNVRDRVMRLADISGDATPEIILFDHWGDSVRAFDLTGKLLWEYANPMGVNDVWTGVLSHADQKAQTCVVIGYNGDGGLHMLDGAGRLQWKYTDIGNVWRVCAGTLGKDKSSRIITTSAIGALHFFDIDGKPITTKRVGDYASFVRLTPSVGEAGPFIVIGDTGSGGLLGIDESGNKLWTQTELGRNSHVLDAVAAPNRPWIAVACREEMVGVYDVRNGERLFRKDQTGPFPAAAWIKTTDANPPMLVIQSSTNVTGFAVKDSDRDAKPEAPQAPAESKSP